MKYLLLAVACLCACGSAKAAYVGKLDIGSSNPAAIAFRELNDGMWLVGAQQQLWHLQNSDSNREVFHVSGFWATRLEGQDTAYGPSLGVNIHEAIHAALSRIEVAAPLLASVPPWVSKISAWTSMELYGGYRPVISYDSHHWIYGVGGKVTIPMDMLYSWASGTQSSGDGKKGL